MRNRWVTMILVISVAMNVAFLAVGGYGYYHERNRLYTVTDHTSERDHHFYEILGLTPAQLAKMTPIADTFHKRLHLLHEDMRVKKEILISLIGGEEVTPGRIEALRKEMAAIQDRIQKTVITHVLDVKKILDAGQQKRFFDLMRKSMLQEPGMCAGTGEK